MTVSAEIYHKTPRGARRRIGKELVKLRELHDEVSVVRQRYFDRLEAIQSAPERERVGLTAAFNVEFAGMEDIIQAPRIPLRLLACAECGLPTSDCTCGVDWGAKD